MPVLDPIGLVWWLKHEADRLKAEADDATAWSEREHATPALQAVADDQRDEALARWWFHTEEFAPVVRTFLERQLRRGFSVLCATMPRARDW